MAKRKKKWQLVEVSWVDADHNAGWVNDEQVNDEEEEGQAYGLLVKKTARFVFRTHQYNYRDGIGLFRIPVGLVRTIRINETYPLRLGLSDLFERIERIDVTWRHVASVARDETPFCSSEMMWVSKR